MEPRKIIVINSKTQEQTVLNSSAVTLGDLKVELDQMNISYAGATFREGRSKYELADNEAMLPTNIPYKGEIINDLVFLLTTPNKKITSGAYSRNDLYSIIKEKSYEDAIKAKFGKNYTVCKSVDLESFISNKEAAPKKAEPVKEAVKAVGEEKKGCSKDAPKCNCGNLKDALLLLAESLYDYDVLGYDEYDDIKTIITDDGTDKPKSDKLTKSTLKEMFGALLD